MKIPIASPLFGFEEWDFEETDTIAIIKKTLGEILEGNPSDYLLIFGGKILDEETELKELDFKKTPFIYIYIPHEEEEEDNDEFTLPNELGQLPEIMILQRLISNGFPIPGPDYFLDNRDNVIGFINNVVNTIQQIAPELERFVTDPEILARFLQLVIAIPR
ncbi:hypothetical protein GPJ56_009829 [Histomonas meleagridis]|uniref:uncharacterized protein n=1 Tax=Histomonas meleagridis TaxID=135588 RepID=UPI00355ABFB3|nr:hypothetical protein GPJ56_009829 [Histomonas meleagridis]KAH0802864.1 hypothetical protein GO595_004371 [Histomonas meleagridis]